MLNVYPKAVLEHALNPRHQGLLVPADVDYATDNAVCGDSLRLTLRLDERRRITAVGWTGENCAISRAAASMLGEVILGETVDDVRGISPQMVLDLIGIPRSSNRVRCALLSLRVLTGALYGPDTWQAYELDAD